MDFQSQYNLFLPIPVKLSKKSQTVPDMSFSPREIIQKFSRGERVPLGFQGMYDPEDMSPFVEDPTRDPSFDFGDYVEEKHAMEERLKKANSADSGKKLSDLKRKARHEELSASDATSGETTSGKADNSSALAPND